MKIEVVNEEKVNKQVEQVMKFGRETMYMGLGVVSLLQENADKLVKRGMDYRDNLIERGEKMADENRGKVTDLVEMPQSMAKDTVKKATETFDKYSEQVLTRVHIPTAHQIETMTKKVNSVDRKLDKVIKENASAQQI